MQNPHPVQRLLIGFELALFCKLHFSGYVPGPVISVKTGIQNDWVCFTKPRISRIITD
jgi:hypothetical protein